MKRTLQGFLVVTGVVMVIAGVLGVILGADQVLGEPAATAGVDSEFRFYAAWYLAAGVLLLRAIPRVETAAFEIRLVAVTFFVAACGRALSMLDVGAPHGLYVALMVIEFAITLVIVPAQALVARGD